MARVPRIDLHAHTTASDGTLTPAELVRAAQSEGLEALAVTGHDTVAGVAAAQEAADGTRLRVLSGVELSALHEGRNLHLLVYGFDPMTPGFMSRLANAAGLWWCGGSGFHGPAKPLAYLGGVLVPGSVLASTGTLPACGERSSCRV